VQNARGGPPAQPGRHRVQPRLSARRAGRAVLVVAGVLIQAGCGSVPDAAGEVPVDALIAVANAMLAEVPEARLPWLNDKAPAADSLRLPRAFRDALAGRGVEAWRQAGAPDTTVALLSIGPGHRADGGYEVFTDWFVPVPGGAYSEAFIYRIECAPAGCTIAERQLIRRSAYGAARAERDDT
jgi:hypothetical protein